MKKTIQPSTGPQKFVKAKAAVTIPDMETIKLNVKYALTMNCQDTATAITDYMSYYGVKLRIIVDDCQFELLPELSKKGRLHYHGTILFSRVVDIANFYYSLPSFTDRMTICIKEIDDPAVWNDYCTKQRHIMYPFMKNRRVPYKVNNNNICKVSKTISEIIRAGLDYFPDRDEKDVVSK